VLLLDVIGDALTALLKHSRNTLDTLVTIVTHTNLRVVLELRQPLLDVLAGRVGLLGERNRAVCVREMLERC
jgi:hypothetical protein